MPDHVHSELTRTPPVPQESPTCSTSLPAFRDLLASMVHRVVRVNAYGPPEALGNSLVLSKKENHANNEREPTNIGTGMILDPTRGFILTSYHIIEDAYEIEVVPEGQGPFSATLVDVVVGKDLALLKIGALPKGFEPIVWGDSQEALPGDWVITIGYPFAVGQSATKGIVSATHRVLPHHQTKPVERSLVLRDLLQVDAPIFLGNSGGPLLNLHGEVIGMNALILNPQGGTGGIGFAIPSNVLQPAIVEILEARRTLGQRLGLITEPATEQQKALQKRRLGMGNAGITVAQVYDRGSAQQAGLIPGDMIFEMDHQVIQNSAHVSRILSSKGNGALISLTVLKKTQKQPIMIDIALGLCDVKDDVSSSPRCINP